MSDVRLGVSASPPPVFPWKFWAKPQFVPEPPIKVTGVPRVTVNVMKVFAVRFCGPRSIRTTGPAALPNTGVAPAL
jgi:hypothetical protein